MKLTKETLRAFLDERPGISPRGLALHAGLNENAINQLYNKRNINFTERMREALLKVLPLYGWPAG